MNLTINRERIIAAYETVRGELLAERNETGCWTGELSTSALSSATAVMAIEMVRRQQSRATIDNRHCSEPEERATDRLAGLIRGGIDWLAAHQNADGGWGDTTKSVSNISTTMLALAAFQGTGNSDRYPAVSTAASEHVEKAGGVNGVVQRYGRDRTFSAPILTQCALAGLVDWRQVPALPFELGCLPARFYKAVRLPVVSYALPALIAIGQVRQHFCPSENRLLRLLRRRAAGPSLAVLDRIQPANGGFLEATPLTSFVTMSLAGMGLSAHPVVRRGLSFIVRSVRDDGSWPIDTNLATWVTTLSVNALEGDLPESHRAAVRDWLLGQQHLQVHPYTNADPGGWAWTDLPGGVPDADDTSGALLALMNLCDRSRSPGFSEREKTALTSGINWLLGLQNRDGGWPTFCRGWGTLPFDRSAADITAHVLCAMLRFNQLPIATPGIEQLNRRARRAVRKGFNFLERQQRADGSWLPLWFGNQHVDGDANPTYGTARVLAAYRDAGLMSAPAAERGVSWLMSNQNLDRGWGGAAGVSSSVEETALAVEALFACDSAHGADPRIGPAMEWLVERVEANCFRETEPIGFYFAKLWYFEKLYPIAFMVSALRRAMRFVGMQPALATARLREEH